MAANLLHTPSADSVNDSIAGPNALIGKVQKRQGFSLVEILFALSILSIIIVIALPIYFGYSVRSKISEGVAQVKPAKMAIIDTYLVTQNWPDTNNAAGLPVSTDINTQYVDSVAIARLADNSGSSITIAYNTDAVPEVSGNNTLIYIVRFNNDKFEITCLGGTLPARFRTKECR